MKEALRKLLDQREGKTYCATAEPHTVGRNVYDELKMRIHRQLLESLDMVKLATIEAPRIEADVRRILQDLVMAESMALNHSDRERLVLDVEHEVFGLGPLEVLMSDPEISDILVNNHQSVFVERHGKIEETEVRFRDEAHLMQIIGRIVSRVGRRIDEHSPMVDARLPDGSRVNAIIPPLAIDGPILSIRRFGIERLTMKDLVALNSMPQHVAEVLEGCVKSRLNILISGGTGSGKTTLLNCLSNYIPGTERIVTIEDSAELKLQQRHVLRLETRPPNIEGSGTVTQRDLVRNALRMRPDRIVLGEVRGGEALDMIQAMNTGHDGSISTIHANAARDALARVETMMMMAGYELPERALREQIASALDIVIQLTRLSDGTRKLVEFAEITGMEGNMITIHTIFGYEQTDVNAGGKVVGDFYATGVIPEFLSRLERYGNKIPASYFLATGEAAMKKAS